MDFSAYNPLTSNPLNLAARENDVVQLRKLLRTGRNPNCTDNRGWTALHEAAANDSHECLAMLLEFPGTRALAETFEGETALLLACRLKRSLETIETILDSVENIAEYVSNDSISPLHVASSYGQMDVVHALAGCGAPFDVQDYGGDTPLHEAARAGHVHVLTFLLYNGANPTVRNSYGHTAFHLACLKGQMTCVRELYPFVVDLNERDDTGNTALMLAAQHRTLETVEFLLSEGADPDVPNEDGVIALGAALLAGIPDVFRVLLVKTDITKVNRHMFTAVCKPLYFNADILNIVLESDLPNEYFNESDRCILSIDPVFGVKCEYETTPPLCSLFNSIEYVYNKSPEMCEKLLLLMLTKGASVNPEYVTECPPLAYLHYVDHALSHEMVIETLVSHGCNVDYVSLPNENLPDAILASINGKSLSLCVLLTYSLKVDPEHILFKLVNQKPITIWIPIVVVQQMLHISRLPVLTMEKLRKQMQECFKSNEKEMPTELAELLKPHPASLMHFCRATIRESLRRNLSTTQEFLRELPNLPIPIMLQYYLRFM